MKKEIFGIAATMLLVGTMAITSCSDDCVFGYDEEWDDMIPRSEMPRTKETGTDADPHEWKSGECAAVTLSYMTNNTANITEYQWKIIASALAGSWQNYKYTGYVADEVKSAANKLGMNFTAVAEDPNKSAVYSALGLGAEEIGVKGEHGVDANIAQIGDHFVRINQYKVKKDGTEVIKYSDFDGVSSYPRTLDLSDNSFYAIIH